MSQVFLIHFDQGCGENDCCHQMDIGIIADAFEAILVDHHGYVPDKAEHVDRDALVPLHAA